jgi:2-polyprenyl-3-methyl-5-hydroxy-6-metoxy-1,4-benzoquinol methylase
MKCPWCQKSGQLKYKNHPAENYHIFLCNSCQLMFLSTSAIKNDDYSQEYYDSWGSLESVSEWKKVDFRNKMALLEKFNSQEKKLLEIGCGHGFLIEIAQQQGWHVCGIESSKLLKKNMLISVAEHIVFTNFFDMKFADNSFSAVVTLSVLEHITAIREVTEKITKIIKPNGLWLIVVPDFKSFSRVVLQKKWPHFNLNHKLYFSTDFFKKLIQDYPYTIEYLSAAKNCYDLFYLLNQSKVNSQGIVKHLAFLLLKIIPRSYLEKKISLSGGNLICLLRKKP